MTTPDPFADDQDALNRPGPPIGITTNAYCPDCDVRWKAEHSEVEWPCWVCDKDRKPVAPPVREVSISGMAAAMAGCVGMGVLEAEAREWEEAWQSAWTDCFPDP